MMAADISRLTRALLLIALGLALLHHTDHVLRVDHSGWPFRQDVTPFTFSLLAYPMMLFALFGSPRLYWFRWGLLAVGTAFVIFAHTAIESPAMQYAMWADNRSLEPNVHVHNMLNIKSRGAGTAAIIISMLLNTCALLATISMLRDRLRGVLAAPSSL